MKRRLPNASNGHSSPVNPVVASGRSPASVEKRNGKIHPLGTDLANQMLTPRSLARNAAELDALRSRVQELEQKLSQHDMDTLATSKSTTRLPPLNENEIPPHMTTMRVIGDHWNGSHVPPQVVDRIATAPEFLTRKHALSISLSVPALGRETSTSINSSLAPVDTMRMPAVDGIESHDDDGDYHLAFPPSLESTPSQNADPPSPIHSVISTSSPHREQAKISLEHDGDTVFAVSQRNRLYQIVKRLSSMITVDEEDLVLLKKLVDAEIGDVIQFLIAAEHEKDAAVLQAQLLHVLQHGSPAKHRARQRVSLPRQHPVWSIQYPLQKIARNLEHLSPSDSSTSSNTHATTTSKMDVIVLVASGAYNPIHMLHIRAFYVARQYVETNYKFPVVGAFISPTHDTFVRAKNRRSPRQMLPRRHRLALIEAAVAASSWIEADKWEITRRRVLDYLSTLTHVREMCESHFPAFRFHVMYVCGCNTVVKLSHTALRDEGFGCITVCRPAQAEMAARHLGRALAKTTTIVEDTGVLPCELERATSLRVRRALAALATEPKAGHASSGTSTSGNSTPCSQGSSGGGTILALELMVGKPALQYLLRHGIPSKLAGLETWSDDDRAWRESDLAYVEYTDS